MGAVHSYFRYQQHRAQENALQVYQEIAEDFHTCCGWYYGLVEPFQLDDADYVLVMSNAFATKGKAVAVIDQNLAPGLGGITYQEIAAALYDSPARPPLLSIVGGLGGKDISEAEFDAIARDLERVAAGTRVAGPRLLYTQPEWERMHTLLRIAGKEVAL
jgi:pyruvate ferredoxin oxidoreductase alpha subunit